MPRIPFPRLEMMTEAQRRVHDEVVSGPRGMIKGPLLAALHNPELADRWQKLGELLRYRTSLKPIHSELAILVTARRCDCPFEWHAHEGPARAAGLLAGVVESLRQDERPEFDDADQEAVYEYAWELDARATVSEENHRRIVRLYGITGVVELTALVGYYTMVAMTLNAHDYALPDDAVHPFESADRGPPAGTVDGAALPEGSSGRS